MNVKALLLDQSLVAGIGNIYADEICFAAGVLPSRKTTSLVERDIKKLYSCSKSILTKAIKYRGTTFNNYIDSEGNKGNFSAFLKVYARKGKPCLRCRNNDSVIEKSRVAGRGTHFCRVCQK
jgi:formamidopyrimidine-DNA glycosylase